MSRVRFNANTAAAFRVRVEQISACFLGFALVLATAAPGLAAPDKAPARPAASLRSSLRSNVRVSVDEVQSAIAEHVMDVAEFRFIREQAEKLGVRVYLFGGTAAAYAHYVKWDQARKNGDTRYQPDRFDYDFTNIYRSTQDLDIVVDGTAKQIEELQEILGNKYPHFLGSNARWEVRSLRDAKGSPGRPGYKEALLNDFDFLNQHTDSNSTGMIEVTATSPRDVVRDLRDWTSTNPHFLVDVVEGKLTYYFAKKHFETSRAKAGYNPEIFSVMRALTKAFQFDLGISSSDYKIMKKIVNDLDINKVRSGELARRFADIAKKLVKNAVNLEEAMNVLDDIGLREKLRQFDNGRNEDSVAFWANKEPLRSQPVGDGNGKTAKELGIDIVAHETNSFLAYESITRAHTGDPNVFISRNNAPGEAAVYGNGFYTQVGREGARGTGLTIRFKVDPRARLGVDFTKSGNYVVFTNKKAFRVIPESLNLSLIQYFEFLSAGQINHSDRAILEKFRRRLARMKRDVTTEEKIQLVGFVKEKIEELKPRGYGVELPALIGEFFDLDFSTDHPEILEAMIDKGFVKEALEMMSKPAWKRNTKLLERIAKLNDHVGLYSWAKAFAEKPGKFMLPELVELVIETEKASGGDLVTGFSKLKIGERERKWLARIAPTKDAFNELVNLVATRPEFDNEIEMVDRLLSVGRGNLRHGAPGVIEKILSKPVWRQRTDLVRKAISQGHVAEVLKFILVHDDVPGWEEFVRSSYHGRGVEEGILKVMENPKSVIFAGDFEKMIRGDRFELVSLAKTLALPHWTKHPELVRLVMMKEGAPKVLSEHLFSQPHWRAQKDLMDSQRLIDKTKMFPKNVLVHGTVDENLETVRYVLSVRDSTYVAATLTHVLVQPGWERHPELIDIALERTFSEERSNYESPISKVWEAVLKVLAEPHWASQPDLMSRFIKKTNGEHSILKQLLGLPQWRTTDAPLVYAEVTRNLHDFVPTVLVHKDAKNREALVEVLVRRRETADYEIKRLFTELFIESGWEKRPDLVAGAASAVRAQRAYGGNDKWADVLKEARWSSHPEIVIALIKNESTPSSLIGDLVTSTAWRANSAVIEAAARFKPSPAIFKLIQGMSEPERSRLVRLFVRSANLETLKSLGETEKMKLSPAETLRIMDELLVRKSDSYDTRETAILTLAPKILSPERADDVRLLERIVEQNIYAASIVTKLFLGDPKWRTHHSDVLFKALKLDLNVNELVKILLCDDLKNRNQILREMMRINSVRLLQAAATFLGQTKTAYDRQLAEEIVFNRKSVLEVVENLVTSPRAKGERVWYEIMVRRGAQNLNYSEPWKSDPEILHHSDGYAHTAHKPFKRGFTFMTEEQFVRAGFSPALLAFKRAVRERVFRAARPASRCEVLFTPARAK